MMVTPKTRMIGAQVSMTLYLGERGRGRGMSTHQKFRTIICIKAKCLVLCPPLTQHLNSWQGWTQKHSTHSV